jgi:putative transposase
VQRLQAFKFELRPDGEQQRAMCRFAGSCRFVYNKALALQKNNHQAGNPFIGYVSMAAHLPLWKREAGQEWLKDAPSQALQQALKDLEKAYQNFFAQRAGFPRFKRKGRGESFRFPEPKQIELDQANSRIRLPKLGWLRYRNSRDVLGEVRNVTVSQSGAKWFVSIQIHTRIANARKDFLHKTTTTISQNHALVCIEDLQLRNLSKSSKGNSEQHGKRVRQKSSLNRAILDQGWGEFRRQLDYKVGWNGGLLLAVPPHNTSRTCPCCGHLSQDNRPTQAKFLCVDCGYENHADVVGAINVLERGYRLLACGERAQSGHSMKQEPIEAPGRSSRGRRRNPLPSRVSGSRQAEGGEDVKCLCVMS